jgi:hypothetical protein
MGTNEVATLHYHEQPEWLQVETGTMVFTSARGNAYILDKGASFEILSGEVHKVTAGPDGAQYKMWTPKQRGQDFRKPALGNSLDQLIIDNLNIPAAENRNDTAFLRAVTHERLVFRRANGQIIDLVTYLAGLPGDQHREAGDNIRFIHVTDESVVVDTLVYTLDASGRRANCYRNVRVFVRNNRNDVWRCRIWVNHPNDTLMGN